MIESSKYSVESVEKQLSDRELYQLNIKYYFLK